MSKITAWFALTVKPRHEKAVAEVLRGKGLEVFLPLYRSRRMWSDRVKLRRPTPLPRLCFLPAGMWGLAARSRYGRCQVHCRLRR